MVSSGPACDASWVATAVASQLAIVVRCAKASLLSAASAGISVWCARRAQKCSSQLFTERRVPLCPCRCVLHPRRCDGPAVSRSLNFETMQHEAISDDLWVKVADVMRLTPEQRRKVHLAFDCYGPQRTSLLQQQQQLVQELRGLLGSPGSSPCKQPAGAASTSTASGSSGALSTRTFAAAGAPRGAAVGSSRGSPGSSAAGSLGSAHTLLCSLGAPAAGSGAGQKAAHPSQASGDPSIQRFASSSDGAGNGAGSDGHATARVASSSLVPGTMDLHACIQAEQVLAKLDRNIQLQRAASLQLLYFYIYLLSSQQHADALLAAYPYSIKVPAGRGCQVLVCLEHLACFAPSCLAASAINR